LQSGQQASNCIRHIPQLSSLATHRHTATAVSLQRTYLQQTVTLCTHYSKYFTSKQHKHKQCITRQTLPCLLYLLPQLLTCNDTPGKSIHSVPVNVKCLANHFVEKTYLTSKKNANIIFGLLSLEFIVFKLTFTELKFKFCPSLIWALGQKCCVSNTHCPECRVRPITNFENCCLAIAVFV